MTEIRVRYGEDPDDAFGVRINTADRTFLLGIDLDGELLPEPVSPRLLDLLEIACAVFAADGTVSRGGPVRQHLGAGWRRRFRFTWPARDPMFWNDPPVMQALVAAVETLTDDRVSFEVTRAEAPADAQAYLELSAHPASDRDRAPERDVLLFSGGLDSLAGAVEALSAGRHVTLVTHRSAQKTFTVQSRLVDLLRMRFPDQIQWVPIRATRIGAPASETTQRSRTLLFAALALFVRQMVGGKGLALFENGVVSHNLPISPQVIGTMATRTTHPLALRHLSDLIGLVTGDATALPNPYAWLTKAEVVDKLAAFGHPDLIEYTVSCNQVRDRSIIHTHCGACSQCLDRRMALIATGLAPHDDPDKYETEVIAGARETDRSRTMGVDWTRHAVALSAMTPEAFLERFGGELARIILGHADLTAADVTRRAFALHRRHGQAVQRALETAVHRYTGDLVAGRLPGTALLKLFVAEGTEPRLAAPDHLDSQVAEPRDAPTVLSSTDAAVAAEAPLFPLRVTIETDAGSARLTVRGLGTVTGAPARVAAALRWEHEEDLMSGCGRDRHRFVPAGELAARTHASKAAVTQNVRRCRRELAELYEVVEGEPPEAPLLIETRRQKGYRLDPECRLLEPPA